MRRTFGGLAAAALIALSLPAGERAQAANGYALCTTIPNRSPTTWVFSAGIYRVHSHFVPAHGPVWTQFNTQTTFRKAWSVNQGDWAAGVTLGGTKYHSLPPYSAYVTCE
jgi:hypothetical protein